MPLFDFISFSWCSFRWDAPFFVVLHTDKNWFHEMHLFHCNAFNRYEYVELVCVCVWFVVLLCSHSLSFRESELLPSLPLYVCVHHEEQFRPAFMKMFMVRKIHGINWRKLLWPMQNASKKKKRNLTYTHKTYVKHSKAAWNLCDLGEIIHRNEPHGKWLYGVQKWKTIRFQSKVAKVI